MMKNTNEMVPHTGTRNRMPKLTGMGTIAVGDRVRLRGDEKRVWTITGVSTFAKGIVLTIEHTTLVTKQTSIMHTSYLNVTKA